MQNSKKMVAASILSDQDKALKASEEKYRYMFANNPQPMFIFDLETLAFLEVNDAATNHYLYSLEEFLSMTLEDIHLKEDIPALLKDIELTKTSPNPKGEWRNIKKNGEIIFIEIISHSVIFDEKNARHILINDITFRKQAEEALKASEERYHTFINSTDDITFLKDENLRYLIINQATIDFFGKKKEEIIGSTDFELMDEKSANYCLETDKKVIRENKLSINEELVNGRIYETHKFPVKMTNGLIGIGGIVRDITERKQVEETLRESKISLDDAQEIAKMGSWEFDIITQKQKWSKNYFRLFNLQPFEIEPTFEYFKNKIHPDDLYLIDEGFKDVTKNKAPINFEMRIILEDGNHKWLQNNIVPIFKGDKIVKLKGTNIDITLRKQAEEALKTSENRYSDLVSNMLDGVYQSTPEGKFLSVNDAMVKMFGYQSKEEMLAIDIKKDLYVFPENRRYIYPESQIGAHTELCLKKKDGSIIWVEDSGCYIKDIQGNVIRHEGVLKDITERKQVEDELKESEEWNKIILQTILSGVFIIDAETCKIVEVNNMALKQIGLSEEEVIGVSCHKFICPADENNCPILDHGMIVDLSEKTLLTADGTPKDIIKSVVPLQFRGRKFLIESFVDITELKKAQEEIKLKNEELLKINNEKDKFFSIIAHDLRSPFNSFLGLTQVMAEELPSLTKDEIRKFVVSMRKSATNLFRLLENLLEWSRIQQGLIPFKRDNIQILPIIHESIEMIIESAKIKEIKISYDIPNGLEIFADDNILQTIIRNLVSNAIKFTPKGGQVFISAKSLSDNSVEVSIKDTGIGIDKIMIDNLFRLDVNTSRKGTEGETSTGLGLIICKDFIEKHKGKLRIESEKGKGSTFYFTLPNKSKLDEKIYSKENEPIKDVENHLKNLKILIAEDDEISVMIISMLLKRFSIDVLVAKNGFEAVEICRNITDIDIILMDIQMPEMDGYEATKQIRKFNTDLIIIAQTAHAFPNDKEKAIESGCNDYLTKPINEEELKQKIMKLLKTN